MNPRTKAVLLVLAAIVVFWPAGAPASTAGEDGFLGRWDITAPGSGAGRPLYCWLEVKREGGTLKGRFNPGGGAVFDLPEVAIENGELRFQYQQGRPPNQATAIWKASVKDGRLEGTAALNKEVRSWSGVRGPVWPATPPSRKPGKPVDLFNGKDVSGWLGQIPGRPIGWFVKDGILQNLDRNANNIYSEQKFNDFRLEVEFKLDPKSGSGIYLRGRYEIQISDGYGIPQKDLNGHSIGALYGFVVPPVNAARPAGEWQTYEITLIANRVTVILNGIKLMENAEVPGITGGALDADERASGPIMIQGDHGTVQFRKVRITPLI